MDSRQIVLVSTAGISVLNAEFSGGKAKEKGFFHSAGSVPSSELGPSSSECVPGTKGEEHTRLWVRGWGSPNLNGTGETAKHSVYSVWCTLLKNLAHLAEVLLVTVECYLHEMPLWEIIS
jgi:hypothetical protein